MSMLARAQQFIREKREQLLHRKRLAYLRTFCDSEGKPHQEAAVVLADLKRFCGINRGGIVVSPVSRMTDPYATVYRAGLRDAYLRISTMLGLDESDNTDGEKHEFARTDSSDTSAAD